MAHAQTWTRNISKKSKELTRLRPLVNDDALEGFKRRAEGLGLIIHTRAPKPKRTSVKDGKK